ncbi:MAG TPA: hypothetical protein VI488_02205 [Candidatus Angelobacter sp.]
MREIDSARDNSEARLHRALRSLSASSPADAPSEIGETVAGAFRRHHARRRAIRRTALAATLFAVLLPAAVLLMRKHPTGPHTAGPHPGESAVMKAPDLASASPSVMPPIAPLATGSAAKPRGKKFTSTPAARQSAVAGRNGFVILPSADQAVRGEELRVIRLELTGRALRMVGAPVSEEIEDRRVLADLVVGQDGTAYAVRLVR